MQASTNSGDVNLKVELNPAYATATPQGKRRFYNETPLTRYSILFFSFCCGTVFLFLLLAFLILWRYI